MKPYHLSMLLISSFFTPSANSQDLFETYQLALTNDPEYQNAYLHQYATAESKSQSIAQMLPQINIAASSARDRLNNKKFTFQASGTQNYWSHSLSFNFTQPVFHWDHWIQLSQSENKIAEAEALFHAKQQALMLKVTESYFNILAAEDNLNFSIAEKKAIAKQLEQAKQRFEVGLIAITDVHEAQAAYDQARANEIEAANLLDDSKENLREIIGENDADLQPIMAEFQLNRPEPEDISEWTQSAQNNNFNIIAQLNRTEVARKDVSRHQSGHMPTLDIVANYAVQDSTSTFGLRGDTQSVGIQFNMPIFEGGATLSRVKQADFEFQKSKQDLTKAKRTVTRQVKNAYRGVLSSISRVQALKASVLSSKSALQATEAGFEVGTRTMVDVLSEQRNLFKSKRDYSRSRYDYLINGIRLKEAAGNLGETDLQKVNGFLIQGEQESAQPL